MAQSIAAVFCDVCNIGVSSEVTMHSHIKGRRHTQAVEAADRRKTQAKNSLYCHGFPPSTPHTALRAYFQLFGPVARIMVETQKGCYCIVQYDSEEPVQRALRQRTHQLSEFSLTVRPRRPITTQRRPPDPERHQHKVKAAKETEEQDEACHEQLMASLRQENTVLSQMEVLYETLRLSDQELERRKRVCGYLHSVLQPFLPTGTIHQFGSSENGLGMTGCDMDLFLDLHDTQVSLQWEDSLRQKLKPVSLPYIREIQSLKTTEGPLMPSQLRPLSLVHVVKLVSRILMHHGAQCSQVLFVPSVRCPIVRFLHTPSGVKCDLSINNRLALRNTRLLRMCGEERRLRMLVFAVRYWGRWKQVSGNASCGPRLTNYCLSLLVLFYLASTSPPVLPSVQQLAELTASEDKCVIEGWDCSLPNALPPSLNTQPADELLSGFFQFYDQLCLSSTIILTRSATTQPMNDFLMDRIQTPSLNDFKVKAMAVQDPFVLCHNTAHNINNAQRDQLTLEFKSAAAKTCRWGAGGEEVVSLEDGKTPPPHGLPYLFSSADCQPSAPLSTPDPSQPQSTTTTLAPSSLPTWFHHPSPLPTHLTGKWTCPLTLDLSTLSQEVMLALRAKGGDYRAAWFRRVRRLLLWALADVFLLTVTRGGSEVMTSAGLEVVVAGEKVSLKDLDSSEEEEEEEAEEEEMCVDSMEGSPLPPVAVTTAEGLSSAVSSPMTPDLLPGGHSPTPDACVGTNYDGAGIGCRSQAGPPGAEALSAADVQQRKANGGRGKAIRTDQPSSLINAKSQAGKGTGTDLASGLLALKPVAISVTTTTTITTTAAATATHCVDVEMTVDATTTTTTTADPQASSSMDSPLRGLGSSVDFPPSLNSANNREGMEDGSCGEIQSRGVLLGRTTFPQDSGQTRVACRDSLTRDSGQTQTKSGVTAAEGMMTHPEANDPSSTTTTTTTTPPSEEEAASARRRAGGGRGTRKKARCRPLQVFCEGTVKAWYGRKVTRANLVAEGHADDLELEKLISEKLAARDTGSNLTPLRFHCWLCPGGAAGVGGGGGGGGGGQTEAQVWFQPSPPAPKEFSVFFTFFKSYFLKLAAKHLLETPTV